jgi:hypothetical protein
MTSVAGQIRIDLLANSAQFKAGMREAGREGFGSFRDEAEKFDRWFESRKQVTARMGEEGANWQQAMYGAGGAMHDPYGYGLSTAGDKGPSANSLTSLRARQLSLLPWGTSMRTEMSREAALTAAAIGEAKQTVVNRLSRAAAEIGQEVGTAAGIGGPVGRVLGLANAHPVMALGTLALGYELEHVRQRYQLANEVRGESLMLGQSAEDTSRMKGIGFDAHMLTRFQRNMSDKGPEAMGAFAKLGLNPDALAAKPLIDALKDVGDAFDSKVTRAADRSSVAMHLFGRGGADVIATLSDMKRRMDLLGERQIIDATAVERAKSIEAALTRASNKLDKALALGSGGESGFKNIARTLELLANPFDWKHSVRTFAKEDAREENAARKEEDRIAKDRIASAKALADAPRLQMEATIRTARDTLARMVDDPAMIARAEYLGKLMTGGMKAGSPQFQTAMKDYDYALGGAKLEGMRGSVAKPEERYEKEMDALDRLYQGRGERDDLYWRLAKKHAEDYYREVAGLDEKNLRQQLASPLERYRRGMDALDKAGKALGFDPELMRRGQADLSRNLRGGLGITDWRQDYAKDFRDLSEARGSMRPEEYDRRRRQLRERATGDATQDIKDVSPIPAMERGGLAAYQMIVNSMLQDPKTKAAEEANKVLDQIEKNTRPVPLPQPQVVQL